MQNLRYKLLFFTCALLAGVQTILGAINASEHYTYYTRQFLSNLGVRNPLTVQIKRMSANDKHYDTAAGYANGTAIYLNEDIFEDGHHSEGVNLFTCAHEAAHHALRHPYQVHRNSLAIEQEADVTAARMLCRCGYRWVLEEEVDLLRQLVNNGQGGFTDGKHPTTQQQYNYLRNVLAENPDNNVEPNNAGPKRKVGNAGPKRNPDNANRPKRDADKVGPKRNPVGNERNPNNAGAKRKPSYENNHDRDAYKSKREDKELYSTTGQALKDLLNSFNNLSREQKMIIAGIVGMRVMGWL